MDSRYEVATEEINALMDDTKQKVYNGCDFKIKILLDKKQRKKKGKVVLATTEIMQEKLKFMLSEEEGIEYDFLTIIDSAAWEFSSDDDKIRLLRHEVQHMHTSESGKLQIVGHDVSDFYEEIKVNVDNEDWYNNLSTVVESVYEQEKDNGKV
jgi:predicted metallopeptidase